MSLSPYKALWGDSIAFTFSEELGFEEGGNVWILCPHNLYLVTSWWFVHPLTLFMVEWHLGEVYLVFNNGFVIYCSNYVFLLRFS